MFVSSVSHWSHSPLILGNRYAVALLNRSPSPDTVSVRAADFGLDPTQTFTVRDVWAGADRGTFTGSYATLVPGQGVALLVLTL